MFDNCVTPQLIFVLDKMVSSNILGERGFYLAGGTGLALQLGHRRSEDLDFFSPRKFEPDQIKNLFFEFNNLVIMGEATGTLHLGMGTQKVSFLYYPFNNLYPFREFRDCPVADYRDIAAMKLIAISQRGAKKDFVDLHTIINQGLSLTEIIKTLQTKYPVNYNLPHIVKSIAYFEDANQEAMPVMRRGNEFIELSDEEWNEIKRDLTQQQRNLIAQKMANIQAF